MTLAVVGDSFASLDKRYTLWPQQLAEKLNLKLHNLGRCGADTMYIHTQMKYAIEKLNASHIVVWQTHPDRVLIPRNSNISTPLTANKVINVPPELNDLGLPLPKNEDYYVYPDYEPSYISDNINTLVQRYSNTNPHPGKISNETADAFASWTMHLQNSDINNYNKSVYVENMFYYLNERKIKSVMIDIYSEYDLPKSDYVSVLNGDALNQEGLMSWGSDPEYNPIESPTNHFPLEYQERVSDFILKFFN